MYYSTQINRLRILVSTLAVAVLATACSNGGSGGSGTRESNSLPSIQLDDGEILGNGSSVIRIPASDDTGIASVSATLLRQGKLDSCGSQIDLTIAEDSLLQACLADQPTCSVEFIPGDDEVVVYPPPLYAPVGLEYELSFVDRDGAATDPVRAVFCFDVGPNTAPVPAADTYQLVYPSTIQRNGVIYNSRCEKQPGSDGVLANDDDDEHVTNTCLRAELLDLPRFATNISTFRNTFRSDGGFRYEGLTNAPTADSFTYRVTDGVNPPSDPITVNIVFSGENNPPIAVNDTYTIAEDTEVQLLNVLDNDSDPEALPLSITTVTNGPTSGFATIRNGVLIEYRPNENFSGVDQFNYIVADSAGVTATALVEVQVDQVNDAPDAVNDEVTTLENVAIEINVLANDSDPEGDTLTVRSVAPPTNGTAEITASGLVRYTPAANFSGEDAFEYTIADPSGATDTATAVVNITFVNVAPSPVEDFFNTSEGEAVLMPVLANDVDNDDDPLEIIQIEQPTNGTAEIVQNQIRYTPNENFNGDDALRYQVSDGYVEAWAQVNISVGAVNDLPQANDDDALTTEAVAVVINVLDNDTDLDGDQLSVQSVDTTSAGTTSISGNGSTITFTPNPGYSGTTSFGYTVSDGNGGTDSAVVSVRVSDTNFAPDAQDDVASTNEEVAVVIDVLDNDTDPDEDRLTIEIVSAPGNGTAEVVAAGIRYTPADGFDGTDTFTYRVSDAGGLTDTASVRVTVSNVNVGPVAEDDTASTAENTAVTISVLENDSDPDGSTLTIDSVGTPNNGTVVISGSAIEYTPETGFDGTDSFSYTISDAGGLTATATVTVSVSNVNVAPVATDDTASTPEETAVTIDVLDNDTDADGTPLTVESVTTPGDGTATISDGSIIYTPDDGFDGTDSFDYTIADSGGLTATATVTVTVSNVNAAPLAQDDAAATPENTTVTVDVRANDTDPDGDSITIESVTTPGDGTATISGGSIIYTPDDGFDGTDSFDYTIADSGGLTATATVTVTVSNVNAAPVAQNDAATTPEDTAVTVDVLDNDSDPDGDTIAIDSVGTPANGTAAVEGDAILYTPDSGFDGSDTFTYTITDADGLTATASVTVTVSNVNQPPVAVDDEVDTEQDDPVSFLPLNNDSDPDGDSFSLLSVTQPANGSSEIMANKLIYRPNEGFSGTDSFQYTIEDSEGATGTATVTITVTSTNADPVAVDDIATTEQSVAVTIDVLGNDSDADDDTLTIDSVTVPGNGTAEVDGTSIVYTPNSDFSGDDGFSYTVLDGNGGSDTANVTVSVSAVNNIPVAIADTAATDQDTAVVVDVLSNDSDADGDELTIVSVTEPANGTAEITANGISYTPAAGFDGEDSFDYVVSDGNGGSATAGVTVTVSATNGAPVAVADTADTDAGVAVVVDVLANDTDEDLDTLTEMKRFRPGG